MMATAARPSVHRSILGITPMVALAIALAWVFAITAEVTGRARLFHHGTLAEGGLPIGAALGLFLLAWQVMVVAMMLPSSLSMVRLFHASSARQPNPGVVRTAFLGGYLVVWGGFGALAFGHDVGIHWLVHRLPWLEARPWVIVGGALALAGAFQFSGLKERCLSQCRHPAAFLLQHYRRGLPGAFRLGWKHGLFCLGCCWALMLVMFAAGVANLWWMVGLGALMFYEKVGRHGDRVTPVAGAALLALAGLVLVHPSWLPGMLGGSA
jgi:predicted metal-binding membrane protein